MRPRSNPRMLLYFGVPAVLALVYGIFSQFTAPPSQMVKVPNNAPVSADNESESAKPTIDVKDVQQVRYLLHVIDYDERMAKQRQQLIRMGEKAFRAYEVILSDPKSRPYEIAGVIGILRQVKADRRRFIKPAIARLTDSHRGVRYSAVQLLERIGSPAEASPVVALLSDEHPLVVHDAAKTLATIGGEYEVVAMDVWLRGVSHRDDVELRKHVQKCRDELKRRLDEARVKGPSAKIDPSQESREKSK